MSVGAEALRRDRALECERLARFGMDPRDDELDDRARDTQRLDRGIDHTPAEDLDAWTLYALPTDFPAAI